MATRINKYLSEIGYCSRREADRLILEGKVTINGKIPEIGTKVEDSDQVEVKGQRIEKSKRQKNIYLAFNKPVGIVCTTDRKVEPNNVIDFIKYPTRIFPIGRLDKLTQGLNRQIRRMCETLGYRVRALKRVRIMNIKLDIPTGKYRDFTKEELIELNRLLEKSSKIHD